MKVRMQRALTSALLLRNHFLNNVLRPALSLLSPWDFLVPEDPQDRGTAHTSLISLNGKLFHPSKVGTVQEPALQTQSLLPLVFLAASMSARCSQGCSAELLTLWETLCLQVNSMALLSPLCS